MATIGRNLDRNAPKLLARDLLDPTDRGRLRVVAVVDDDRKVTAGEEELEYGMRADVACASGHEDNLKVGQVGGKKEFVYGGIARETEARDVG